MGSGSQPVLQGCRKKTKVTVVANEKDLEEECFAFYVSNKLTWNAQQLWAVARDRWAIEVQFRDLKQRRKPEKSESRVALDGKFQERCRI